MSYLTLQRERQLLTLQRLRCNGSCWCFLLSGWQLFYVLLLFEQIKWWWWHAMWCIAFPSPPIDIVWAVIGEWGKNCSLQYCVPQLYRVISAHLSPVHTGDYSRRIRRLSPFSVTVAEFGDKLSPFPASIVAEKALDRALWAVPTGVLQGLLI